MGGAGGPPPPTSIIVAAFLLTLSAGVLDTATLLVIDSTSTHMSGKLLKIGVYIAKEPRGNILKYLGIVASFMFGAILSGVATRTPEHKTPKTAAKISIAVGVLTCIVAALLDLETPLKETIYLAAFTAGVQNALTTTVTGFMRTTHFTGTLTDVGLLLGQMYPDNVKVAAHLWKTKVLGLLCLTWIVAGMLGSFLYSAIGAKMCYVPGALCIVVGVYGLFSLHKEAKAVAAEEAREAAEKERTAAEEAARKANPFLKGGSLDKLRMITKEKVFRMSAGMAALQDLAKEMDGNLESMPSPAIKAFHLAYNTRRASSKFLTKLSANRVYPNGPDDVQTADLSDSQRKLMQICEYMLKNPMILEALEKEHGGGQVTTSFADWAAAYAMEFAEAANEVV